MKKGYPGKIIYLLILLYTVTFSFITIQRFNNFYLEALDFGIFDNALWNTLQGKLLYNSVKNISFLGEHFSPLLIPLSLFYLIWDNPRMLLIIQSFTLALGALPLYLIAKDKLKDEFLALSFAAAYLLAPLLQQANLCDYHAVTLQPPLAFFAFYFLQRKKFGKYFLFLGLLLLAREDTFLYILGLGVYAFFFAKERKIGVSTVILGLIWGFLAMRVAIPYFRGSPYLHTIAYGWLGDNFLEIGKTILFRPFYVIKNLPAPALIMRSLGFLFIPLAFLPFLSKGAFILIILPALQVFLSSRSYHYKLAVHYAVPLYPYLFISGVYGAYYLIKNRKSPQLKKIVASYLIVTGLVFSHFFGYTPFSRKSHSSHLKINVHSIIGKKFIAEFVKPIPEEFTLCAQGNLYSHLGHRQEIYLYRGNDQFPFDSKRMDYIFLDVDSRNKDLAKDLIPLLYEGEYGVVAYRDGYLLLKRGHSLLKNKETYRKVFLLFEAEKQYSYIRRVVRDPQALNESARYASVEEDEAKHLIFGPYKICPPGDYQVDFRLKTDNQGISAVIAEIDVSTNQGQTILAERKIRGTDFEKAHAYGTFSLKFSQEEENELEFRLLFTDQADLWVDFISLEGGQLTLEREYRALEDSL